MTTTVKLRQKAIKSGKQSLFLDYYPAIPHPVTGKETRREFLGKYIFDNPKDEFEVQHNKDVLELAQQICLKRQYELSKPEVYSEFEKEQLNKKKLGQRDFVAYFKELADKRKSSTHDNWASAYKYLVNYTGGTLKFADMNEDFLEGFKEYLQTTKSNKSIKTTLATNSAVSYFNKVKATLREAYKKGYLLIDLNARVEPIKTKETHREVLTLDELNKLAITPCNNPLLKRAALFSALTGLRFSDIQKLTWGEVEHIEGDGYILKFRQQKTDAVEYMPISEQAAALMGNTGKPGDKVFDELVYSAYHNKHLFQWLGAAGITKDCTFHGFRHTYATLQLSAGTAITTVSKMLGHKDLKTTMIYAKIVDRLKKDATGKITLDNITI
jgi:integrase